MSEQVMIGREFLEQIAAEWEHDNDKYMLAKDIRAALSVSAQPAGEVPEVVGYGFRHVDKGWIFSTKFYHEVNPRLEGVGLMTVAQHTRIVAALKKVEEPERKLAGESLIALQNGVDARNQIITDLRDQRDQLAALLARCQEKLDCHRDAVLWGDVCAALAPACNTATKPVYLGFDLASGPDMTVYDCGQCPTSGGCLGCCMKAHAPGGL